MLIINNSKANTDRTCIFPRWISIFCFILSALFFLYVSIPPLQCFFGEIIINIAESFVKRPLTHEVWHSRFLKWSTCICCTAFIFAYITGTINENKLTETKKNIYKWSAFIFFSIFTFLTVLKHEPWGDEIQAWQLAKEYSIPRLLYEMRYEGHFLPWYLVLMPFAKLGFPLITLNLISWFITALSALYFLLKSPFSLCSKITLLFTNGFLYWYPAVSRCYVLILPLLFLLASIYKERNSKPLIFGILLALLANTHAYIEGFVGIVSLVFLINDVIIPWKNYSSAEKKSHILSLVIMASGVIFAAVQVLPGLFIEDKNTFAEFEVNIRELINFLDSSNIRPKLWPVFIVLFTAFLIYLFVKDKKTFLIFFISIAYMCIFAVFLYGTWIANRALLWFFVMIFVLWIAELSIKIKSIVLLIFSLFLISPGLNKFDFENNFSVQTVLEKYIKDNYTPDIPVFIHTTNTTAAIGYSLQDKYSVYHMETLLPVKVYSYSSRYNFHKDLELSQYINNIKNSGLVTTSYFLILVNPSFAGWNENFERQFNELGKPEEEIISRYFDRFIFEKFLLYKVKI